MRSSLVSGLIQCRSHSEKSNQRSSLWPCVGAPLGWIHLEWPATLRRTPRLSGQGGLAAIRWLLTRLHGAPQLEWGQVARDPEKITLPSIRTAPTEIHGLPSAGQLLHKRSHARKSYLRSTNINILKWVFNHFIFQYSVSSQVRGYEVRLIRKEELPIQRYVLPKQI